VKSIQPVHMDDTGPKVFILHHGLLFLIMNEPGISNNDRRQLQQQLAPDVQADKFGLATEQIVRIWQEQLNSNANLPQNLRGLVVNGDVNQKTAAALNWLLGQIGALRKRPS
jgi:hypothetical protein